MDRLDELYDAFCDDLPAPLRGAAQDLPFLLRLTPKTGIRWSEVFENELTLGLPALVAESMPVLKTSTILDASLAHLLGVVRAFALDRLMDKQVCLSVEAMEVLKRAAGARDRALGRVYGMVENDHPDGLAAEKQMCVAITMEKEVMRRSSPCTMAEYAAICRAKQGPATPASLALAAAAGWSQGRIASLERMILSIACGLQCNDDVRDWEDDEAHGGSWVVRLARWVDARRPRSERSTWPPVSRRMVFESGVMAELLRMSSKHFRHARRRAESLGIRRVTSWAWQKENSLSALALQESTSAGYANRAQALAAFAREVIA